MKTATLKAKKLLGCALLLLVLALAASGTSASPHSSATHDLDAVQVAASIAPSDGLPPPDLD